MQATTWEASSVEHIVSLSSQRQSADMPVRKTEWGRALRAVRRLIADKDDTKQVFEIMNALSGQSIRRGYERLLDYPDGGLQAYHSTELADLLQDHGALEQLPEGSVGRAYLDFVRAEDFTAYGLAGESRKVEDSLIEVAHPYAWYARRLRDVHDVWHVLTGYEADALGEGCLVAFSYSQTRSRGFAVIGLAVAIQFMRARTGYPAARSVMRAFKDGKKARWLPGADYGALLAMPLKAARAELRISEPMLYQQVPKGLRNAYRGAKA